MPIDDIVIISLPYQTPERRRGALPRARFPSALMTGYHGMNWALGASTARFRLTARRLSPGRSPPARSRGSCRPPKSKRAPNQSPELSD